jgi:hypothetical protein
MLTIENSENINPNEGENYFFNSSATTVTAAMPATAL